ncbi:MAG: TonB-dependent receptor [Prevotella sp.]|nr:TonB-dependent receptor [Prevotella sp.]
MDRNRFLLLFAFFLMAFVAMAQRNITGQVIENDSQEPMMQATVRLLRTDSTMISGVVSDVNGRFTLKAPSAGRFIVQITSVGYKPYTRSVSMTAEKDVPLGKVTMKTDAIMLEGATVTKNVAKVTTSGDTVIYNATAYRTPEGSVIEELVKKLPGAEVSDDGTVTINGKQVKKVLIDGKEFMTGDTKTAIKNLPTSIVERIKTYDEKSDLSRVTGIDDGEDQTVLDFGLKRGMNKGIFANVDGGIGTEHRYSGRMMAAAMKDDLRLMGFGNANNVNDMGFGGGGGGGRFGGGGRNGLQATKMAALNFNYEKRKLLKWNGSLRWNHSDGDAWSRRATENFVATTGSFSNSINQNFSRSNSWNAQMRLEWTPDTLWNINFRPTWSYSSSDGTSDGWSATFSDDPYSYELPSSSSIDYMVERLLGIDPDLVVNKRHNASLSYSDSKRVGGTLQVNRKLGGGGRNVTLRVAANYSEGDSRSMSDNMVNLYHSLVKIGDQEVAEYRTSRYNLTPQKQYDYSARLTYSEPIARAVFLQFSYNFQYKFTKSNRSTYDYSKPPYTDDNFSFDGLHFAYRGWDDYLGRIEGYKPFGEYKVDSLSKFSQYKNYIHTGEIMFRIVRKAYNFNVGLQIVPQSSEFSYRYLNRDTVARRTVVNWSPTANFRWKISNRGQMRFEYRGTTSQPSMSDLLPISDNSDPLNVTIGNSDLKPSFTQRFMWRYNNYFERHQRFINANFNFSTTSNAVTNTVRYDRTTGGRTTKKENINGNWNIGGNFVMNTALDTLGRFNINTSTDLSYSKSVGYLDVNRDGNLSKSGTHQTSIGQRLGASYRNDWFEFEANGRVQYNYVTNKLQPQSSLSTWAFNYGFNSTAQTTWGMQITTSLNMSSRRGYSDAAANTNELIWNAQVSQSFLKGKPLSVRLEFYDILKQQSNFTRSINAMTRTDNEYNAINCYAMLRVSYRLNLFGDIKNMRGGRGGGPEGRGDGPGGPEGRGNRGGWGGGRGGGGGFGGRNRF